MSRTQFLITLSLVMLAGYLGGLLSGMVRGTAPAIAVQPQGRPIVVEASEFRLVDKEGRIRAVLGFRSPSEPELRMDELNGEQRVSLGIRANGYGGIWVYDKRGDLPSASLHTMREGRASLMLYDDDGVPQAELGNELELKVKAIDPNKPYQLKFWKGKGPITRSLVWHAP